MPLISLLNQLLFFKTVKKATVSLIFNFLAKKSLNFSIKTARNFEIYAKITKKWSGNGIFVLKEAGFLVFVEKSVYERVFAPWNTWFLMKFPYFRISWAFLPFIFIKNIKFYNENRKFAPIFNNF